MAEEPDTAVTDAATSASSHDTKSTLTSPLTDSSVNTKEPLSSPLANEDSLKSSGYHPGTADGQRESGDGAYEENDARILRNLDDDTTPGPCPGDGASKDGITSRAHSEDLTIGSSELIQELQRLREKVSKIEEQSKRKPNYPTLEAEWRVAREEVGIEKERGLWKMFMERRKEIAGTPIKLDIDQPYTLELNDLAREMDQDPVYENDIMRWRKNWERRLAPSKMWARGRDRYDDMQEQYYIRFPFMKTQDGDGGYPEDSDTDGSLDFELNLDRLRHRYLRKVDRLHEERDVRRMQSLAEAHRREQQKERLARQLLEAKSGHGGPGGQASKAVSVDFQRAEDTAEEPLQATHAFPKINRVDWVCFNALREVPEKESFVIDILIGEPEISLGFSRRANRSRRAERDSKNKGVVQDMNINVKQPAASTGQSPLPERIRIHSTQLIRILDRIHGDSVGSDGPLIIMRPFRVLIHYHEAPRRWCRKLEKKFETADTSTNDPHEEASTSEKREDFPNQQSINPPRSPRPSSPRHEQVSEDDSEDSEEENPEETKSDDDSMSPTALKHLSCLLEFMDSDLSRRLTHLSSGASYKVFFSDIWHLFKPGDNVIASDGKQVYRVIRVTSSPHRGISWSRYFWTQSSASADTPIMISCTYVDFDEKRLGPVRKKFVIKKFDSERAVTSLEVYPLRFYVLKRGETMIDGNKEKALRENFIARGRKFVDVAAIKHMHYAGPALETREDIESQVIVDFELALSTEENQTKEWRPKIEDMISIGPLGPSDSDLSDGEEEEGPCDAECCRNQNIHNDDFVEERRNEEYLSSLLPDSREKLPSVAIFPRPLQDTKGPDNSLSEEDLLIMSYRVFGFVLRTRKWETLDLTYLSDIIKAGSDDQDISTENEDKTAFGRLVLPKNHKKMVQSLIAQHFRDKESSQNMDSQLDIVRGKGKGLILLLHGAPGVGKMSTAEGTAELFRKPLFQITCGDLGSTAAEVERALETNFSLANRWGCILLLDEADVFLSRRDPKDFKRNGLVAVFLRVLEYYAGILFLTTNRIGDFDEAFASRIHISLYYPPLDEESTQKVFELNLKLIKERVDEKGRELIIDTTRILSYAPLAEFEAQGGSHRAVQNPNAIVALGVGHISDVADSYLEFTNYLRELYGTDDSHRAKESGIRALDRKRESDYHGARQNPLIEYASRRAATRRERFPQEESHRVSDHRIRTREPQYSENQPRSGRQKHEPPVDVMESKHNYSDHEHQDDGPSPQASCVLHAGRLRDPLDDEVDRAPRRHPRQGRGYSSSRQDLDPEDYEEERRSDVAYESPSEYLTSPSSSRAGTHQPSDPRSR